MQINDMKINDIANKIAQLEDKLYELSSYDVSGNMSNEEYFRKSGGINDNLVHYQRHYIMRLENKLSDIEDILNK